MNKKSIQSKRNRYISVLQRFYKSIETYLIKSENITQESYEKKIQNLSRLLEKTQKTELYKSEYKLLEKLVEDMINVKNIEEEKSKILYSINQYEKSVNFKKYKKPKYKNFD